ncbi:MAG: hypothetical protein CUN55_02205 [Phototrophicales bacterium]|nr:MAG: hypothetical protein CUN55_02205 [Phototrophicales bacterium]
MQAEAFYEQVLIGADYSPESRHLHYSKLHQSVLNDYSRALRFIFEDVAESPPVHSQDTRSLKLIVAHIAEWERYAIMAAGDILVGIRRPRLVSGLHGYVDHEGQTRQFKRIDDFNAYCQEYFARWSWFDIQKYALDMAEMIFTLFTTPQLLTSARLEATEPTEKRLHNGHIIKNITMGWALWITVLEHAAVEHANELQINR